MSVGLSGAIECDLSADVCADRLGNAVDRPFSPVPVRSVIGEVGSGGGWLRRRIPYRSAFQTVVRFRILPLKHGCRVIYRAGTALFTRVFLGLWLAVFVAIAVGLLSVAASTGAPPLELVLTVTVAMASGYVGLVAVGGWLARHECGFLLGVMLDQVEGRIID